MGKKRGGSKKTGKKRSTMRPQAPSSAWERSPSRLCEAVAGESLRGRSTSDSLAPVSGPVVPDGSILEAAPAVGGASPAARAAQEAPVAAAPEGEGGARTVPPPPAEPSSSAQRVVAVAEPPAAASPGPAPSARLADVSPPSDALMQAFFEQAEEKVMWAERQVARDIAFSLEATADAPPPPHVLARRARLRQLVSGLLGMAGMLALVVVVKSLPRGSTPVPEPDAQNAVPQLVQVGRAAADVIRREPPAAASPAAPSPEPRAEQPKPLPGPAIVQAVAVQPAAAQAVVGQPGEAAPPEPAAEKVPAPKEPDPVLEKELARKALSLLERGSVKGAIEASKAAIEADPTDADPYLYWATALLEIGKNGESKRVFRECVQKAKRGRRGECVQFSR